MNDIEEIENIIWQLEEDHIQLQMENFRRKREGVYEGPLPELKKLNRVFIPSFDVMSDYQLLRSKLQNIKMSISNIEYTLDTLRNHYKYPMTEEVISQYISDTDLLVLLSKANELIYDVEMNLENLNGKDK